MYLLKTTLPDAIMSYEGARQYLKDLFANEEHYHCEDNAQDCFPGLCDQVANHMNFLMSEVYKHFTENNSDPCAYVLELMNHAIE